MYCNWRIEEISIRCPKTCLMHKSIVYSFEAISALGGNKFLLRFGINDPQPSSLILKNSCKYFHDDNSDLPKQKPSLFVNLADAFKAPVDKNVKSFLVTNPCNLLDWADFSFHELIYRISRNAESEFSKIEHL